MKASQSVYPLYIYILVAVQIVLVSVPLINIVNLFQHLESCIVHTFQEGCDGLAELETYLEM